MVQSVAEQVVNGPCGWQPRIADRHVVHGQIRSDGKKGPDTIQKSC